MSTIDKQRIAAVRKLDRAVAGSDLPVLTIQWSQTCRSVPKLL
jgi:hypothetical protein